MQMSLALLCARLAETEEFVSSILAICTDFELYSRLEELAEELADARSDLTLYNYSQQPQDEPEEPEL